VNYYLLGVADKQTSHFEAAARGILKIATVPARCKATCKEPAQEDAKKQSSTQLSAPN